MLSEKYETCLDPFAPESISDLSSLTLWTTQQLGGVNLNGCKSTDVQWEFNSVFKRLTLVDAHSWYTSLNLF